MQASNINKVRYYINPNPKERWRSQYWTKCTWLGIFCLTRSGVTLQMCSYILSCTRVRNSMQSAWNQRAVWSQGQERQNWSVIYIALFGRGGRPIFPYLRPPFVISRLELIMMPFWLFWVVGHKSKICYNIFNFSFGCWGVNNSQSRLDIYTCKTELGAVGYGNTWIRRI